MMITLLFVAIINYKAEKYSIIEEWVKNVQSKNEIIQLLGTECLCPPAFPMLSSNPQCDGIRSEGLHDRGDELMTEEPSGMGFVLL